MNNDRELLELAARAMDAKPFVRRAENMSGIFFDGWPGEDPQYWVEPQGVRWNPLLNDGDAFRLAVNLRIDVSHMAMEVFAEKNAVCVIEPNDDPYSATRRAITRAAAEIWKAMG